MFGDFVFHFSVETDRVRRLSANERKALKAARKMMVWAYIHRKLSYHIREGIYFPVKISFDGALSESLVRTTDKKHLEEAEAKAREIFEYLPKEPLAKRYDDKARSKMKPTLFELAKQEAEVVLAGVLAVFVQSDDALERSL